MAIVVNGYVINKVSVDGVVVKTGKTITEKHFKRDKNNQLIVEEKQIEEKINTKFKINRIVLDDSIPWKKQQGMVKLWNSKLFYSENKKEINEWIKKELSKELVKSSEDFTELPRNNRNGDIQYHRMDEFGVLEENKIATARVAKVQDVNYINPEHKKVLYKTKIIKHTEKIKIDFDKFNREIESVKLIEKYIKDNLEKNKIYKFLNYIKELWCKDKVFGKLNYLYIRVKQLPKNKEIQFYTDDRVVRRIPIYF